MKTVDQSAIARWLAAHQALWEWWETQHLATLDAIESLGDMPVGDRTNPDTPSLVHDWHDELERLLKRIEALTDELHRKDALLNARYPG